MPRTGRPREFDIDHAVDRAMPLFWQAGYEATSLADLRETMGGLSSASFYAAFGSKQALFERVVRRYLDTHGTVLRPLRDPGLAPRKAVEIALRLSARMQTDPSHPPGCLITLSATVCSEESEAVRLLLAAERDANRRAMLGCVRRAIDAGDLPDDLDAEGFAAMYDTYLLGVTAQARDGVAVARLESGLDRLLKVWDRLARRHRRKKATAPPPSPGRKLRKRRSG